MTESKTPFRVVVAGRPNVGKSALFNRLTRRRRSIVHDLPGMTRDVLEIKAELPDGRTYLLADTGGYDPSGKEKIPAAVREKAVGGDQECGSRPARRGRLRRSPAGRPRRRAGDPRSGA